jgi:hypothetical protein
LIPIVSTALIDFIIHLVDLLPTTPNGLGVIDESRTIVESIGSQASHAVY